MTVHGFLQPYTGQHQFSCTLSIEGDDTHFVRSPHSPNELLAFARKNDLTHLWLMPEYGHCMSEEHARSLSPDGAWKAYTPIKKEYVSSISDDKHQVIWGPDSLWGLPPEPVKLAQTFIEIEEKLGIPMAAHPGVMGLDYLRKVDDKNYWRYFALPTQADWPMIRSVSVKSIAELPQITDPRRLEKKFLFCFDRNSSQPYAASQIRAGIGQPRAVENVEFDHLIPGFWMARIEGIERIWSGLPLLPPHQEWLSTPLLKMAEQQGCKIHVDQAYIWPDKKDRAPVFHRWAHGLWDLRQSYASGTPERQAIKSIMNSTIGLLRRRNGEGHRDYRPDWYSLILAEERAVVWYTAFRVWKATGIVPIGCYHDSLYYALDSEDEVECLFTRIDKAGNKHSTKQSLGGYKLDWCLPLNHTVKAVLMAKEPKAAAERLAILKRLRREYDNVA